MPPQTYTSETHLLHPVSPSLNSDDWPILPLLSVEVTPTTSPTTLTSLLTADLHTRLTVQGRLPSVPRDLSHLRLRPSTGVEHIQLTDVRQFAYGQYEDGRVEIWAAGKAGWFTVKPSRAYKGVYDGMVEAIEALYYAADVYARVGAQETKSGRKGKRRRGEVSAEEVFAGFAQVNGLGGEERGREVFESRRGFLIKSMVLGKEGVEWEGTGIWEWFVENFEGEVEEVRRQLVVAQKDLKATKTGAKRKRESAVDTASVAGSSRSGRARDRKMKDEVSTPRTGTSYDSDGSERRGKGPKGRKGKSVLRPKTNVITLEREDQDGTDDISQLATLDSSSNFDEKPSFLTRAAASSPSARNRSRLIPTANHDAVVGAEVVDEGIDMGHDNSDDDDSDESEIILAPLNSSKQEIPVRLRKEHTAATGEGDTWSCPLDGCMHKVYAASEPSSQKLIKEHYRVHVNDDDAEVRMELVRRMEAPGQPVNRLMRKIQELGVRGFPSPVLRRY
ncbi:hypothetical protein B9Z65_6913 [Elsinoe australis]|uniref:Uncharacterized protein n=1 Tax=Elsinoe australis TaxID=40998 RepID=A0A2P7Z425_9PEZI|nr:hypothetical protein B9Z65_6913 [Elsinoe australis]